MPKVFISHASDDREFVQREIVSLLARNEISTFYSVDDIPASAEWEVTIRREINECDWVLVAVSPAAIASSWVKAEVAWAFIQKPDRVIPVLIDDCRPGECHLLLTQRQHVDFRKNLQSERTKLLARLTPDPSRGPEPPLPDDVRELVDRLRAVRSNPDRAATATIFRYLTHPNEQVQIRARQAIHAVGWPTLALGIEECARRTDTDAIRDILKGLGAIEAGPDVLNVIVNITELLTGELRDQAIVLSEYKRLGLELEALVQVFRDHHSPYEIREALGQGLFAASYLAREDHSGLDVVVRILRPEFALLDAVRKQFTEVSKRATRYIHENLALTRQIGHFADRNIYYSVRDHIDGVTLQNALNTGKRFEPIQVVALMRGIAHALKPIHRRGEAHLGIKPTNIFLTGDCDLQLGDPSLPVSSAPPSLPRVSYDYRYAAPENFVDMGSVGPAADLYALGCVAYQLFTGRPPIIADNPYEISSLHCRGEIDAPSLHGAPSDADALVLRLLARRPGDRPQNVDAVLDGLDRFRRALASPTVAQRPVTLLGAEARADANPAYSVISLNNPGDVFGTMMITPSPEQPIARAPEGRPIPPPAVHSAAGTIQQLIKGKYRIVATIGRGGMGTVYEVVHEALGTTYALKQLNVELTERSDIAARFYHEARIMARLIHPNIVRVFDIDSDPGFGTYLVMELIKGQSLDRLLKNGRPLAFADILRSGIEVASALTTAHECGLVHRDIKPGNVLIEQTTGRAVVTDFGIAKSIGDDDEPATVTGMFIGTYRYCSPEQIRNDRQITIDGRADVYSLGVVLYEMCSGKRFLDQTAPQEIVARVGYDAQWRPTFDFPKGVSPDLIRLIEQCVNPDRERRPTAALLLQALRSCTEPASSVAAPRSADSDTEVPGETVYGPAPSAPPRESAAATAVPDAAADDGATIILPRAPAPTAAQPAKRPATLLGTMGRGLVDRIQRASSLFRSRRGSSEGAVSPTAAVVDHVQFTVTAPSTVQPGSSFIVDLWAHLEQQRDEVVRRAHESTDGIRIKSKGPVSLARGTVLTVQLSVQSLVIPDPEDTLIWDGRIGNANFVVSVPLTTPAGRQPGTATLRAGGIQLAKVHFAVTVGADTGDTTPLRVTQQRCRKAFASYATEDRDRVLGRIQGMQKISPALDVFLDVASLRSGRDWQDELRAVISRSDIFYLFWSQNAAHSTWVEREWRYALQTRGLDFIDPVPLVSPDDAPPPPELGTKHFNDWVLAFMRTHAADRMQSPASATPASR